MVDDDPGSFGDALTDYGHNVVTASHLDALLSALDTFAPDAISIDLLLPWVGFGRDHDSRFAGIEIYKRYVATRPQVVPFVFMSATHFQIAEKRLIEVRDKPGYCGYLEKPITPSEFLKVFRRKR